MLESIQTDSNYKRERREVDMETKNSLTHGPILSALTKLAVPIMATSLIQMAYNMIDMIWIGRISSNAVASVGAAGMYMWLANGVCTIAKVGGQIKVGHSMGAKQIDRARLYAKSTLQLGIFFALIYGCIMILFSRNLISFLKLNQESVILDARKYLMITCGLIIFAFLNQIFIGLYTAIDKTRIGFIATSVGLLMNFVLDPVLIFGIGPFPRFEVAGAAWATIFSQLTVTLIFILAAFKDTVLFHQFKIVSKPDTKTMKEVVRIGLPIGVQSMTFTGISMILSRIVASFGDTAIAVQKIGGNIESISWMTSEGFSSAVNTFLAQNHGAGNKNRVKKGYKVSMLVVMGWGTLASILLIFFPAPLFRIFINEPETIKMGVSYLQIIGYSQFFMCMEMATQGAFSGLGKTVPPSLVSIGFNLLRIPSALFLITTPLLLNGVWWSISITSVLKGLLLVIWFLFYLKKYNVSNIIVHPNDNL